MDRHESNRAIPLLLIAAGCALYMVSGGIRSNFGIIVQTLADRAGVSYADVSFAVAVGFLFGITFVGHQIGGFLSSWLGGILIAKSGNYQAIWMFDIALCAIASVASYGIHRDVTRI